MQASKREDFVRKIHVKTKELIEKKGKSNVARMNKKRKEMRSNHGLLHLDMDLYNLSRHVLPVTSEHGPHLCMIVGTGSIIRLFVVNKRHGTFFFRKLQK
jgi:hypothetical protein